MSQSPSIRLDISTGTPPDPAPETKGIVRPCRGFTPSVWLACLLSSIAHTGLIVTMVYVPVFSVPTVPPDLHFAHGQTGSPVTVRFLTADDLNPRTPVTPARETTPSQPEVQGQPKPPAAADASSEKDKNEPQPTTPLAGDAPLEHAAATGSTQADGGAEEKPKVLDLPKPEYPRLSRLRGEEGVVLLEIEVLPDGRVGAVRVLQGSPYPRLTKAALAAARAARFQPALRDGQPVRAVVRVPFEFTLR